LINRAGRPKKEATTWGVGDFSAGTPYAGERVGEAGIKAPRNAYFGRLRIKVRLYRKKKRVAQALEVRN